MNNNQDHQQNYSTPTDTAKQAQSQVIEMLHQTLTTTTDLKTYLKQAQWHECVNCCQPQTIFDETVALLDEYIDLFKASLIALDGTTPKQLALPDDPFNSGFQLDGTFHSAISVLRPCRFILLM